MLRTLRTERQGLNTNQQMDGATEKRTRRVHNISPAGRTSSGSPLSKQRIDPKPHYKKKKKRETAIPQILERSVITRTAIYDNWIFMAQHSCKLHKAFAEENIYRAAALTFNVHDYGVCKTWIEGKTNSLHEKGKQIEPKSLSIISSTEYSCMTLYQQKQWREHMWLGHEVLSRNSLIPNPFAKDSSANINIIWCSSNNR